MSGGRHVHMGSYFCKHQARKVANDRRADTSENMMERESGWWTFLGEPCSYCSPIAYRFCTHTDHSKLLPGSQS